MRESTPDTGPEEPAGTGEQPTGERPRWWQRAVPVGVLAAVAVTAAVMALPEEEIALSTSRAPQPFVELAVAGKPAAACADRARVGFRVTSHLQRRRTIGYVVTVDPTGPGGSERRRGELRLAPGRSKTVTQPLAAPDRPYTVSVTLPGRPEQLRLHCREGRR